MFSAIAKIHLFASLFALVMGKSLNQLAMIMSHDAATGYLHRDHVVADWTITQGADLAGQLDCGARSFDYRPFLKDDKVYAHHGGIKIPIEMGEAIDDVLAWSAANPDELVMMYVTSCDGDDGCMDAAKAVVSEKNLYSITDCSELGMLSVEDIMVKAQIPNNGGHVFALFECVTEHYDSSINCYSKDFTCYDSWSSDSSQIPWGHMKEYAANTTAEGVDHGQSYSPWMLQAHWQSTAATITSGTLHRSSLLLDEERSGVNRWAAEAVTEGLFPTLNLVEVDNVCDGGLELLASLKQYNEEVDRRLKGERV